MAVAAPDVLVHHLEARLQHAFLHPRLGGVGDRQHRRVPARIDADRLAGRVLLVLACDVNAGHVRPWSASTRRRAFLRRVLAEQQRGLARVEEAPAARDGP